MDHNYQLQTQQRDAWEERQKVGRYLTNKYALEAVLSEISEGVKLKTIAERLNVSYAALHKVLNTTYKDKYKAARDAYTEYLGEKNLGIADEVEAGNMAPDVAKTAVGIRQWYMERTSGERWGQKSSVDVTHKGVVGLHLEAIRQLSGEVVEGEYTEVEDEADEATDSDADNQGSTQDHPLL